MNDEVHNRNEEVHRRAGIEIELASTADQRVWRWFGDMERMDEYHMARRVLMAEVSFVPCGFGIRIQPMFALVRVVRVD